MISSLGQPTSEQPATVHLLEALGRLWLAGASIDWSGFYLAESRRRVPLPTYPFERQSFWVEPPLARQRMNTRTSDASLAIERQLDATERAEMHNPSEFSTSATTDASSPAPLAGSRVATILEALAGMTHDMSGIALDRLDENASFLDLGLDSLFLTQATQAIAGRFGVPIKFRHLLDECSTLSKLALYIDARSPAEVIQPPVVAPISSAPSVPATASIVSPASETLVERVIREQLAVMTRQLEMLGSGQPGQVSGNPLTAQPNQSTAQITVAPSINRAETTSKVSTPRIAEPPTKAFEDPYW